MRPVVGDRGSASKDYSIVEMVNLGVEFRRLIGSLHDRFQPLLKIAAGQHDAMTAGQALHSNIGADARDLPICSAARMRLAHTHRVAHLNIDRHMNSRRRLYQWKSEVGRWMLEICLTLLISNLQFLCKTNVMSAGYPLTIRRKIMKLYGLMLIAAIVLSGCTTASTAAVAAASTKSNEPAAAAQAAVPTMESIPLSTGPKAPAITNQVWLNTDKPLTQADLNGKVILIDFWTFG